MRNDGQLCETLISGIKSNFIRTRYFFLSWGIDCDKKTRIGSEGLKRFIRYLYEYEQGKRLRNVGFVKVEQKDEDCTLSIHGKGLHMKGERKLDLYLFFDEDGGCAGIWQGTVDNVAPAINYRLFYTKEDVIAPENFRKINGIILESETGRKYAAVWNDTVIDVGRMRVLRPDNVQKEEMPVEDAAPEEGILAEHALPQEEMQEEEPAQGEGMPGLNEPEQSGEPAGQENAVLGNEVMPEETVSGGMSAQEESEPGGTSAEEEPEPEGMSEQQMNPMFGRRPARQMNPIRGENSMGQMNPVPERNPMHQMNPIQGSSPVQNIDSMGGNAMQGQGRMQDDMGIRDIPAMPEHAMQAGVPVEKTPVREEPIGLSVRESGVEGAAQGGGMFPQSDADVEFGQEMTVEPIENICGDTREPMPQEHLRCTKIQRNDMARLPRCEWKWANNSFLLHGYYNYHHLAIIDDGERYRLGVPGIYHPQEAKAASTFGFSEFIPHKDTDMDLTDDEKSSQEQFGYWCRPIKRMLRTQ